MAANTAPIFTRVPKVQWAVNVTAANNTIDLTSGTSYLVFTAGSEGSYLNEIRVKANPSQNTAATVLRVWLNNGLTTATDVNSTLIGELDITATTASAAQAQPDQVLSLEKPIPPNYRIYITIGTAPGGSGEFCVTGFGGDY